VENIHPTAIVDSHAKIGKNVTIGAFAIVEGDVVVGDDTSIASHVLVADGARIGKNCKIHKGTVVATIPQDLKFEMEATTFEIGDNTTIREFCTLNRGTNELGKSTVGSNCLLMAYCHVAHDCLIGDNVILANAVQIAGHVEIEDHVIIGGLSGVHQFCKVGQHVMVGGLTKVVKDIPPYITISENPLRFGGINAVGLRRRGFPPEVRSALKQAYRLIYRSGLNHSQALAAIQEQIELVPEVQNILDFFARSNRGVL